MSNNKTVKEIEEWAEDLSAKEAELKKLEDKLSRNKTFKDFMSLQKSVNNEMEIFKAAALEQMEKHELRTVETDWAKITVVAPKDRLKVEDENKVPERYKKLVPDLKAIQDEYELTDMLVPGVATQPVKKYLKITVNKEK